MKILIYSDPHFCQYSSIVRQNGNKYSVRLENLIQSLNWVEETAQKENCQMVVCAGDFFDKAELNAQEITALSDIEFRYNITHYYLCGNHEMGSVNHQYSSTKIFDGYDNAVSIDKPKCIEYNDTAILFLPYALEKERKTIHDYVEEYVSDKSKSIIVISHNNIKMNYGGFFLEDGFDIQDILQNCDWFFNGHLHNGGFIDNYQNIINVGNLTGQNFSENAFIYKHGVYVLDTDNLFSATDLKYIENPYAFNFYKIDFTHDNFDVSTIKNAVVSAQCYENQYNQIFNALRSDNIIANRIQVIRQKTTKDEEQQEEHFEKIDHVAKFKQYVLQFVGKDEIIKSELSYIG